MTSAFIEPSILPSQDPVMLHIVIEREIREVERKRIDLTQSGGISSLFYAKEGRVPH